MTIFKEEIFGPVLSIVPYSTESEAVEIANDSVYGLSGSVWSADLERAERVARQIRTGQVFINGADFDINAPAGGYKQSASAVNGANTVWRNIWKLRRSSDTLLHDRMVARDAPAPSLAGKAIR